MKTIGGQKGTSTVTVEGRLSMADFRENAYRCRIDPAEGPPISCTFDEKLRDDVLRAMTRQVRVTGEARARNGGLGRLRIASVRVLDRAREREAEPEGGSFWEEPTLEELMERQGVKPIEDLSSLAGGWPKDESIDDFLAAVREWRRGGARDLDDL